MSFIVSNLRTVPLYSAAPLCCGGKVAAAHFSRSGPRRLAKSYWSSIRAAYKAGRHAFQPVAGQEGGWKARNPGQQWTIKFDQRRLLAQLKAGGSALGLELKCYGFGEKQKAVGGTPVVKAQGERISCQRMPRCRTRSSTVALQRHFR